VRQSLAVLQQRIATLQASLLPVCTEPQVLRRDAAGVWHCETLAPLSCREGGSILPSPAFTCGADNDATVCSALGDFYNATNGASWISNNGWSAAAAGAPTDYCTFKGATCSDGILNQLCVRRSALRNAPASALRPLRALSANSASTSSVAASRPVWAA